MPLGRRAGYLRGRAWRPVWGAARAVARARSGMAVRIGQFFPLSPLLAGLLVRTPTPSRFRVRASMRPSGAVVRGRRSLARMAATRITKTAVTVPDKNAAIAGKTIAGDISPRRSGHLIGRFGSLAGLFPGCRRRE